MSYDSYDWPGHLEPTDPIPTHPPRPPRPPRGFNPSNPCPWLPGSWGKLCTLRWRARHQAPLHGAGDATGLEHLPCGPLVPAKDQTMRPPRPLSGRPGSTGGVKRHGQKYYARIWEDGRWRCLGLFGTRAEAEAAVKGAA
jgi:hypothetical protein